MNEKRKALEDLLEEHWVYVGLDPQAEGVVVPVHLKKKKGRYILLQLGHNMPIPMRDFVMNEEGFTVTLSFDRTPFSCWIPWEAVRGLYPEDAREKALSWSAITNPLARTFNTETIMEAVRKEEPRPRKKKLVLRVIKGGKA